MQKNRQYEIGVGLLVIVAMGLLAYMSLKVGALRDLGDQVRVTVVFTDAAGVAVGASVQVAGVEVGRVSGLAVEHDRARVTLAIQRDAGIRRDAIARVRARSVLGEKYVEIHPLAVDSPLLEDGDEMTAGQDQVEIDQLVNQLGPMVAAVDPEQVRKLVDALVGALDEDPERVSRMLADTETILHNAALASQDAPALVSEAREALVSVKRTSDEARPVVKRADALLAQLETVSGDLGPTVDEAHALMTDARGAVSDGRALMSKLDGSTEDLQKVLDNLSEIDKWELRRLLREEGILVRLKKEEVVPTD